MRSLISRVVLLFAALMFHSAVAADVKPAYKVGDRLAVPALSAAPPLAETYREIQWDTLVPKGWDPMQSLKGIDFAKLKDADPRAMDALQKLREVWDNAPVEASLRGQKVRIAGFMLPLERKRDQVTEFLLVPYFGACIHSPPPPANQTIHVFPAKPLKNFNSMDTVWVSGTLDTGHAQSQWGSSGYTMKATVVTPYTSQANQIN